ncbi:MAG: hypothetical protein H0V17_18775, partial [Deltaproteobacteria bacterium]|nr:hypothetical protein [Deltaproteobacteria bacterium]
MRGLSLAILLSAASLAQAQGSGSAGSSADVPAAPAKKVPEEAPVDPTGLIIAGVALAAFALLLLLGRRKKKEPEVPLGELAEVRLVIETDERATVWTKPSLKTYTDRLGEALLHLPIGSHDVHIDIGSESYVRTIQVTAIKRMRLPINFTKERLSRAASSEMQAVSPSGQPQTKLVAGLSPRTTSAEVSPQKTSAARAFPDSSTQSALGAQLAGLIDVELDTPKPDAGPSSLPLDTGLDPGAGAIDFSPQRAQKPTNSAALLFDLPTPAATPGTLELDDPDLEIPVASTAPATGPVLPAQPSRTSALRDAAPSANPQRSALRDAGPSRGRPPTSPLEGIKPAEDRPAARSGRSSLPPATARPNLDISLDDVPSRFGAPALSLEELVPPERPAPSPRVTTTAPKAARAAASAAIADFAVAELGTPVDAKHDAMPTGNAEFDLAPPERSARAAPVAKSGLPDVGDFALEGFAAPAAAVLRLELPKVTAASVMDLTLDDDELPLQRVPVPKLATKATPDITEFTIEDTPVPQPPRRAADDPRPPIAKPVMPAITKPPIKVPPVPVVVPPARPAVPGLIGGRYQKLGGAGVGPIGALYRGRDESTSREIMMEELPRDVVLAVTPEVLSGLAHANIVRFHDHVVEATKSYVITELVEGKSLEQLLSERGGTLASLEAIGIVDQV